MYVATAKLVSMDGESIPIAAECFYEVSTYWDAEGHLGVPVSTYLAIYME